MRTLLPLFLALSACSTADRPFPSDFVFGTAVAGFQVDMGCPTLPASECDDTRSDWYQWITDERIQAKKAEVFLTGGAPSTGPGMYELFPQDFARVKDELKLGGLRLSIEWSRVFPEPTFGVTGHEALKAIASAKGLDFYRRQFEELKKLGLKPLVTLHHYTMPVWMNDGVGCHFNLDDPQKCAAKGWLDDRAVTEIAKYAGFVATEFGGYVDDWATENEPLAITVPGYLQPSADRANPPAVSFKAKEGKAVTMNMIFGHARMYDAVKANDTVDADGDGKASRIGIVYNLTAIRAADEGDVDDVTGAENIDYLYNQLFLNAVVKGDLDREANGIGVSDATLTNRCDFLGVNYYTRITVDGTASSILPEFSKLLTLNAFDGSKTVFWEDYPAGIYEVLKKVKERYGDIPIVISENGYTTLDMARREELMTRTLEYVRKAAADGVNVRGYYWWSLMDNYEWNHGMGDAFRLGLYQVDATDPKKVRTKRAFADAYAKIAAGKAIPGDIVDKYQLPE